MCIIKVNTLCKINEEKPTPVKHQDIALNITTVDPKVDFQNFVLGIESYIHCCEDFWNFSDDIPEQLFVKAIYSDEELTKEKAERFSLSDKEVDTAIVFKLIDGDDKGYHFSVYNNHNSYYSHVVYDNGKEMTIYKELTMLHKYRKTVLIEAEQFDGSIKMIRKYHINEENSNLGLMKENPIGTIYTLQPKEGRMLVDATNVNGEHQAIGQDIFEQTYERCN